MKKFVFCVILALLIAPCCVHPPKDLGLVRFQVTTGEQMTALYAIEDSHSLLVSIEDSAGGVVCDRKNILLFKMGEGFISEPVALEVGEYRLTEFLVLDDQEQVIFATPIEGSEKAYLVDDPLPIEFSVSKDVVTTVTPEVLDTEEAVPADFGYGGFSFEVVETFVFLVSVFVETQTGMELTEVQLTVTSGVEVLYDGSLGAETNAIEVRDGYETYDVLVEKEGYESYAQSFTDVELKGYFDSPLIVVLVESGVSNTITFGGSIPGIAEGYHIFTFDADGVPQSYELLWKMETGASAVAGHTLQTITAWHSGTGWSDQIAAYTWESQDFILADFDDPIPAFDPSSPDYWTSTTTLTWSDSLLQEMTYTHDMGMDKWVYDYNVDDTLKAMRKTYDGVTFVEANWYQYGDLKFPLLPIEMRGFVGGNIPSNYVYETDPNNYKTGPTEGSDRKFTYTPNGNDQIAELVEQEGNGWPPTSWTNIQKIVCTYDTSGRLSSINRFSWSASDWTPFFELPATYSGSVPSISLEELYFSDYYDIFFSD